jgi:hypothetical protein
MSMGWQLRGDKDEERRTKNGGENGGHLDMRVKKSGEVLGGRGGESDNGRKTTLASAVGLGLPS